MAPATRQMLQAAVLAESPQRLRGQCNVQHDPHTEEPTEHVRMFAQAEGGFQEDQTAANEHATDSVRLHPPAAHRAALPLKYPAVEHC